MPNLFVPINPGTPIDMAIAAINNNFAKLDSDAVTKTYKQANGNAIVQGKLPYDGGYGSLYYDANGVPSVLIGIAPSGRTVIRASKEGVDVTTAADEDLVMNSENNLFKIVSTGTVDITRSPSTDTGTATISYADLGLANKPTVFAFGVGGTPYPIIEPEMSGAGVGNIGQVHSFSVNHFMEEVTFGIYAPNYVASSYYGFGTSDSVRYYICVETSAA